jgi:hypothetical protein
MALILDRIHKMRLGTWSHPIPVEEDDEVGTLMREFNDLGPILGSRRAAGLNEVAVDAESGTLGPMANLRVARENPFRRFHREGFSPQVPPTSNAIRFVVVMPAEGPEPRETQGHVTLMVNFFDEVRRRVAMQGK